MLSAAFLAAVSLAAESPPTEAAPDAAAAPACPARARWGSGPTAGEDGPLAGHLVVNAVRAGRDGALSWNGSPIDRARLALFLQLVTQMTPRPHLILAPERGAGCTEVADLAAFVDRHLDCTPVRCWIFGSLGHLPPPPAPPPPRRR